jgi:hypothetical protein
MNSTACTWSPSPPADGKAAQRSALTTGQQAVLQALSLREPPKFFGFTLPSG